MSCLGMWFPRATLFTDMFSGWWVFTSFPHSSLLFYSPSVSHCAVCLSDQQSPAVKDNSETWTSEPTEKLKTGVLLSTVWRVIYFSTTLPFTCLSFTVVTLPSWCSSSWSWWWKSWVATRRFWSVEENINWRSARGLVAVAAVACQRWPSHGKSTSDTVTFLL